MESSVDRKVLGFTSDVLRAWSLVCSTSLDTRKMKYTKLVIWFNIILFYVKVLVVMEAQFKPSSVRKMKLLDILSMSIRNIECMLVIKIITRMGRKLQDESIKSN
jgi:hypothetical protein